MASTIYHIPEPPPNLLPTLHTTLQTTFSTRPLPHRWTLEHKLFRSSPSASPSTLSHQQHILTASHLPPSTYLLATPDTPSPQTPPPESPLSLATRQSHLGTLLTIPAPSKNEFAQLLISKLGALWLPKSAVVLQNGLVYEVPNFTLRVGELKTAIGSGVSRGVVVQIEMGYTQAEEKASVVKEETWETMQKLVRALWEKLVKECRVSGLMMEKDTGVKWKETVMAKPRMDGEEGRREMEARLWCEMLRGRN